MMDKKNILENGLLEQYLLGELNAKDCEMIEQALASDTDLKAQFDALEKDFEILGLENAITPPKSIKHQLIQDIREAKESNNNTNNGNLKFYIGIAASIAVLLMIGSFWMYNQLNDLKQQLEAVEIEKTELNDKLNTINKQIENENALFAILRHPDTEQYILKGNTLMPNGKVVSYVNHSNKTVLINTERLPKLDKEHDYQMWADVEGEMINMGVIAKDQNLMAMNYIEHAESLNITIEPAGGNDHPTVSQLVTNVYLK